MSPQPRVCVVLSGCGYLDGAEVQESVISLLALSRAGAHVQIAAPDKAQLHVVDHRTQAPVEGAQRNVLAESARIARGAIVPLDQIQHTDFDALFLPGGFGVAQNLSSFATEGTAGSVDPTLAALVQGFHGAGKPIGAVCIAPAVLVMALGKGAVTIGSDAGTAAAIESLGGSHHDCPVTQLYVDHANKIVTAPAYMCDASIAQVADGIEAAVQAMLGLCE